MKKKNILILFGGDSPEHEVSVMSARSVTKYIDRDKYNLFIIFITKSGEWLLINENEIDQFGAGLAGSEQVGEKCSFIPGSQGWLQVKGSNESREIIIDIVWPVLHGGSGEDGSLQGYLEIVGVPYVGCGMAASMVCMDKELTKMLLHEKNILTARYWVIESGSFDIEECGFGWPMFVKPARAGSSVGISRVENNDELRQAIKGARKIDQKVIIEEEIVGRELEVAVLGNFNSQASLPGEVMVNDGWYDYKNKYNCEKTKLIVPADLSMEKVVEAKELALQVYAVLGCRGLSRVDMFLLETGELLVNEVNTMPGFTEKSMYPRLWEKSGLKYEELIDRLIELGLGEN